MLLAGAAGGIRWTPPKSWKAQPERPMRAATYTVPAAPGDAEPGECAVFYFGPGQGGGVDENIRRWIGQFSAVDGKPATRAASVRGMKVTHIDVSGSYAGMGGPMAPARTPKPGYRLLGAIIEGPEGAVFFKLTGPAKTVAAARAEFEAMIESAAKG
ncbi:MAG: hypothetical protein FJW37_04450 [Acidobacteria bacterium]|nr:hypothetical protein [Acidobacteriota bacterium]